MNKFLNVKDNYLLTLDGDKIYLDEKELVDKLWQ